MSEIDEKEFLNFIKDNNMTEIVDFVRNISINVWKIVEQEGPLEKNTGFVFDNISTPYISFERIQFHPAQIHFSFERKGGLYSGKDEEVCKP